MKKLALYICVLMGMPSVFGQELQLPSGNQYLADSEFLIMPTYAGIGNNVRVRLSGRSSERHEKTNDGRFATVGHRVDKQTSSRNTVRTPAVWGATAPDQSRDRTST